jgi:V8-like Glu-specific endopeptidase
LVGLWKKAHQTELPTIKHQLSTDYGNSGSPLLVRRKGKFVVIGIHNGGRAKTNEGRAITDDLLCNVLKWEKEMLSEIKFNLMTNSDEVMAHITQQILITIPK